MLEKLYVGFFFNSTNAVKPKDNTPRPLQMAKLKNRHVLSLGVLQGTDKCHTHTQVWCTRP